jgi:7-carboxy-7-deazaguanine synthase
MIAPEIHALAARVRDAGRHLTIETAATVPPEGISCDLASLSPKLRNSAPDKRLPEAWRARHEKTRWQPEVVRAWIDQYAFQLKFVIGAPADLAELESMVKDLGCPVPAHKILLMPEAMTPERLQEQAGWLSEACKERGYRYATRLHLQLYGNRRGT